MPLGFGKLLKLGTKHADKIATAGQIIDLVDGNDDSDESAVSDPFLAKFFRQCKKGNQVQMTQVAEQGGKRYKRTLRNEITTEPLTK